MPMVGIFSLRVTVAATSAGMDSSTIANAPACFEGNRVGQQRRRPPVRGLLAVAAYLVDRLRLQTEVAHHRDADVDEALDDVEDRQAAFDLDRRRAAFLQQPAGVAHRFGDAHLVAEERHVGNHQRPFGAAAHRARVMDHHVERDGSVLS